MDGTKAAGAARTAGGGRRAPVFGPEPWPGDEVWGGPWSYWDVWFAVVCLADCGGDWEALDERLTEARSYGQMTDAYLEPLWSHVLDLRRRMERAGIDAAELAGDVAQDRKVLAKARTKVWKQALEGRAMTPAMVDTPRRRLVERALRGSWRLFPLSPGEAYAALSQRVDLGRHYGQWAAMGLADTLAEVVREQLQEAGADPARELAVRRAALTCGVEALRVGDDSCGVLGGWLVEMVAAYCRTDWETAGIDAGVYWCDLLEVLGEASNHGGTYRQEAEVLSAAGVGRHLDLVEATARVLHAEYAEARMPYQAREVLERIAHAQVAAGAMDRFAATAALLGSEGWMPLEAMVACALARGDMAGARTVLTAADRPGLHQDWVRRRAAELEREEGRR